jgi:hypothetical protein
MEGALADRDLEIWKLVFEGVQTMGIVGGAIWAAWRFRRERVHAPQIEFSVDAVLHGPSDGKYAAEYVLTFENKGKTRVQIKESELKLRVRGIKTGEELKDLEGMSPRLDFPYKLVDNKQVMPEKSEYTFFEPGIKQEWRYISKVPADYQFIVVSGKFFYDRDHPHTAERVITVKPKEQTI